MEALGFDDCNFVNHLMQTDEVFSRCLNAMNEELEDYYDYKNENPDDTSVSLNVGAQCMSISLRNYAEAKYFESLSRVSVGEEADLLQEFNNVWELRFASNNLIDNIFSDEIKEDWVSLMV